VVVASTNVVLLVMSHLMGDFERYTTMSGRDHAVAVKLAIALTMNTAVVPVLTYAYVANLDDVPLLFSGVHTDTTAAWHDVVVTAIVTSAAVNAVTYPMAHYAEIVLGKLQRCCCKRFARTQHDLNKLYTPPKFALAERSGQFLSAMFYTLMLSSGAPLLWPIAGIYCLLQYFVDKRLLLRSTSTPPRYSGQLAKMMRFVMPWAALLHLALSVWMFGNSSLPSYQVEGSVCEKVQEKVSNLFGDGNVGTQAVDGDGPPQWLLQTLGLGQDEQFDLEARVCRVNGLVPLVALILLTAFLAITYVLKILGSLMGTMCQFCGLCNDRAQAQGIPPFSVALQNGMLTGFSTYHAYENPDYKDLFMGRVFSAVQRTPNRSI